MSVTDSDFMQVFLDSVLNTVSEGILGLDSDLRITRSNRAARHMLGWSAEELAGKNLHAFLQYQRSNGLPYPESESPFAWLSSGGVFHGIEDVFWRKDGTPLDVEISTDLLPQACDGTHAIVVLRDISVRKKSQNDLVKAYKDLDTLNQGLEKAHSQLLQSEKMASIGQLAAGVAHEINNPMGFINSNLGTLKGQVNNLLMVLDAYRNAEPALAGHPGLLSAIERAKSAADLEFLQEDITSLIEESIDGVQRVKRIVDNLKNFSHIDNSEWQVANLEQGLESTLNIVWNEIKYKADVVKEYAGLPEIECIASQLNQVFMNLLVNSAQAIEERGTITLRTGYDDNKVWIEIEDNGKGIQPEHIKKLFEPFFTTKPVGKGTGLGLSMSYSIVQRHNGRIEARSTPGKSTVFRVTLPRKRQSEGTQERIDS